MNKTQLKQILRDRGYTQREVAARMGISYQALYERLQAKELSISTLTMVAKAIDVDVAEIMKSEANTDAFIIEQLRCENKMLREMLEEKEQIIQLLEKKRIARK